MYFTGTLKKGGGEKAITAILRTAASAECHIESATLVAPAGHKLIVISGLLDSSGLLDNSVLCSWSCCVNVLCSGYVNVRPRSRVGVEVVPVKFWLSKGAETSVTLSLLGLINWMAACCSHLSSPRGVPAVSEGLQLLNRSKTRCKKTWKKIPE